ncbi:hypothetical protein Tco_0681744 [Tanacetum coccineum]|uniref:Uncharacterized protein n=1 Tax=Tanacetum coccineum TaxID=301880 RepID=A0ABQ4XQU3_9ASTR
MEVTSLDNKLEKVQRDCDALGKENRELCSQRDVASEEETKLQSQLADARVAYVGLMEELARTDTKLSEQGYNDAADELRTEVTQFIGSGVEGLVQRLLLSDEFHAALAYADFNKALVSFTTTPFPFLGMVVAAAGGALFEVTQILSDKLARSTTSVAIAPPFVNEASDKVPFDHAFDDSASSI